MWDPAGSQTHRSRGRVEEVCTPTPEMKPSSSFLLLKFVHLTSELRLIGAPLLRKILDLPLIHDSLGTRVNTPPPPPPYVATGWGVND